MTIEARGIISTDKHWLNRPETAWSNTYEFTIALGGTMNPETAKLIMAALVLAERQLHLDVVQFTGARMANYVPKTVYPVPDEQEPPYDPTNTIPYLTSAVGSRDVPLGDGVEPKDVIWWVSRAGAYGRVGTLEIRGALPDGYVLDDDGDWTLTEPTVMETLLTAFAASLLAIEETYGIKFVLLGEPQISATYTMVGKKKIKTSAVYGNTYEIEVTSYSSRGVRPDRSRNKWFNRA
jgi:hypothetical protein